MPEVLKFQLLRSDSRRRDTLFSGGCIELTSGLAITFGVLRQADSPSALRLLLAALDHGDGAVQREALAALLLRRPPQSQREILLRWERLSHAWPEVLSEHRDHMNRALRDAILGDDPEMCAVACRASVTLEQYDLVPVLLNVVQDAGHPCLQLAATAILGLADRLYEELATPPRERARRRDPQLLRRRLVHSLEVGVRRYSKHLRRDVVEAFLVLVGRENVILKQILQDPHDASFLVVVDVLAKSPRPGVIWLLLSYLDDPQIPSAALALVANRGDETFLRMLMRKIGREPSSLMKQNLKRLRKIGWLRAPESLLDILDDEGQHGLVRLVMCSGIARDKAYSLVEWVLLHGQPSGRLAAAEALSDFAGAEANALALTALGDPNPLVQASIVSQIRDRGIPGILPRLVTLLDSPHTVVRQATRKSLSEFTFKRYLNAFDALEEDVKRSTGLLVKKVDAQTVPLVQAELHSQVRSRRLRGLAIAEAIEAVADLEPAVLDLMHDEDHLIRQAAATALSVCHSQASRQALEVALEDRSLAVQEAARASLAMRQDGFVPQAGLSELS